MNIFALGSLNPTKKKGLERALTLSPLLHPFQIVRVACPDYKTEILGQPTTLEETVEGALHRAQFAYEFCMHLGTFPSPQTSDFVYGVGVEGGLIPNKYASSGFLEQGYCIIYWKTDGEERYTIGTNDGFEHPPAVIKTVFDQRVDISEAYRRCGYTTEEKIGSGGGCIKILTHGKIDREEAVTNGILRALIPLENAEWFGT